MTVHALLVGINAYPLGPLRGCVPDVRAAAELLTPAADLRVLLDADATRAAVVDGWRGHLGQAGPGDSALFWFCGHGRAQRVHPMFAHLEPSGQSQGLVTVDSADGTVADLLDMELSVLIGEVAARGAHVVTVLDCCHSGGATRDGSVLVRGLPRLAGPTPLDRLLPELRGAAPVPGRETHVRLAACGELQLAFESEIDGGYRGRFSHALLAGLRTLGGASYRDLTAAVASRIEQRPGPGSPGSGQTPSVYPPLSALIEQPFLGGALGGGATPATLRYGPDGWQVDLGLCHGLAEVAGGRGAVFEAGPPARGDGMAPRGDGMAPPSRGRGTAPASQGDGMAPAPQEHGTAPAPQGHPMAPASPGRLVRALVTEPDRSLVEPVGWAPEVGTPYPVTLRGLPLPPLRVDLGPDPGLAEAVARWAPSVRAVAAAGAELRVSGTPHSYQMMDLEGFALAAPGPAPHVARQLEHYAWWRQLRGLRNPASRLAGLVELRAGTSPGPGAPGRVWDGSVRLSYRGAQPPTVFLSLVNRSDVPLWCVLLDLTDRYRSHAGLFPGAWVGPAPHRAAVLDGEAVAFSLPVGQAPLPGATATDWLKLIVSETPLNPAPFALPPLAETSRFPAATPGGFLDLGALGPTRDAGAAGGRVGDWATSTVRVVTTVPGG
ncbi:caspase family protein [Longispora sp. K20-0274]|uniref:caspase family protein n=1 Tax=Longispora sp. K20-0274 TaxID=3088255 RepID=UPI00399AA574